MCMRIYLVQGKVSVLIRIDLSLGLINQMYYFFSNEELYLSAISKKAVAHEQIAHVFSVIDC